MSHYCEQAKSDSSFITWDNNLKKNNLDDGVLALERLESKLLGDDDYDHVATTTKMPPPSTSRIPILLDLPLASQPPLVCGVAYLLKVVHDPFYLL